MRAKERLELVTADAVSKLAPKKIGLEKSLYQIFAWQTLTKFANELQKQSWALVQPGKVPEDDAMRSLGRGEHIIAEAGAYSVVATVNAPRAMFDPDAFILAVSKKYKIDFAELRSLYENTKVDGTPPLSKRVLEA